MEKANIGYKRKIEFKDAEKNIAKIEIEIENGVLSMHGDYASSFGQIKNDIKPKNNAQKELVDIWDRWHLNDMKAGCEHQRAEKWNDILLDETKPKTQDNMATWTYKKDHPKGLLREPCPICGYKYGTAWLKEELPEDIEDKLNEICDEIEEIEDEERTGRTVKEAYEDKKTEELTDYNDEVIALALHLDLTMSELEEIEGDGNNRYTYDGIEYFVGTEEEAEEEAREYLEDDDGYMWRCAVEAKHTTSGLDEWIQEVIDGDGVGHILNSWDGSSDTVEVNNTEYTIIRRS